MEDQAQQVLEDQIQEVGAPETEETMLLTMLADQELLS
jgi:hypothetical protein